MSTLDYYTSRSILEVWLRSRLKAIGASGVGMSGCRGTRTRSHACALSARIRIGTGRGRSDYLTAVSRFDTFWDRRGDERQALCDPLALSELR
jgi:hypothetical protein